MSNKVSFPHPVLGNEDDVVGTLPTPEFSSIVRDEAIQLRAKGLKLENVTLSKLIADKKAGWQIRLQCPRTYLRKNYITQGPNWHSTLPGYDFEGRVDVEVRVIALSEIVGYRPIGIHEDYGSTTFKIKKGDTLAILPATTANIEKDFDPLKAPTSSFVRVTEGDHQDGPFQLVLDDDLISIVLSKNDWVEYSGMKRSISSIHGSLVLSALTSALSKINDYQGLKWSDRIMSIVAHFEINLEDPLHAAQVILGNPISRMFGEVNSFLDRGEV